MSRTRVHNLNISLDGYAAGEHVTMDAPIGGAEQLFAQFDGGVIHGIQHGDGPVTVTQALTATWSQGVGAEIMGRRKFGPQSGPWNEDDWRGWWGDAPPFRTPVFVLTHYEHPPIEFDNGTSFTSSTQRPTRLSRGPRRRRTARMYASAEARPPSVSSWGPISSTSCTS